MRRQGGRLDGDFNEQNERSLIPQWQARIDFDVRDRLYEYPVKRRT